jgi:type I restriction enzyme S subunit
MIRLRLDASKVCPRYLALCWNSRILRQQIERDARTTAGIYKINQDHVSAFSLPVPSVEEQKVIVSRLEADLSETNFAQRYVESEIDRAEVLRQSILRRAFSGELVAQDPTDEPASVLLNRIRSERGDGGTKKARSRKNGTKEAA